MDKPSCIWLYEKSLIKDALNEVAKELKRLKEERRIILALLRELHRQHLLIISQGLDEEDTDEEMNESEESGETPEEENADLPMWEDKSAYELLGYTDGQSDEESISDDDEDSWYEGVV